MLPNYVDSLFPLPEPQAQPFGPEFRGLRLDLPEDLPGLRQEAFVLTLLVALLAAAAWWVGR